MSLLKPPGGLSWRSLRPDVPHLAVLDGMHVRRDSSSRATRVFDLLP
jgi:hypothetical protein